MDKRLFPLESRPSHCAPARRPGDGVVPSAHADGGSKENHQQPAAAFVSKKPAAFTRLLSPTDTLMLVLDQDEQVGMQFVQMIRRHTAFQAILARSLSEVHHILAHLKCDFLLLTDGTFPAEDLERFSLHPAEVEPPALLDLTFLCRTYDYHEAADVWSVVKALNRLLSIRDALQEPPSSRRLTTWQSPSVALSEKGISHELVLFALGK